VAIFVLGLEFCEFGVRLEGLNREEPMRVGVQRRTSQFSKFKLKDPS